MSAHTYILDAEGNPKPEGNPIKWAKWFESANRVVAQTRTKGFLVSTVFLGIDHNFSLKGPPLLWETMIFDMRKKPDQREMYQRRYSSREEAVKGHEKALKRVRAASSKRTQEQGSK